MVNIVWGPFCAHFSLAPAAVATIPVDALSGPKKTLMLLKKNKINKKHTCGSRRIASRAPAAAAATQPHFDALSGPKQKLV